MQAPKMQALCQPGPAVKHMHSRHRTTTYILPHALLCYACQQSRKDRRPETGRSQPARRLSSTWPCLPPLLRKCTPPLLGSGPTPPAGPARHRRSRQALRCRRSRRALRPRRSCQALRPRRSCQGQRPRRSCQGHRRRRSCQGQRRRQVLRKVLRRRWALGSLRQYGITALMLHENTSTQARNQYRVTMIQSCSGMLIVN